MNGDLIRFINDVSVPAAEAFTSSTPIYNFDTSTDWKPYTDASLLLRDSSISSTIIKNQNQDVSLNNLRVYTDGSLNLKVNQTLFDTSISSLAVKNSNQDVSLNNVWVKFGSVDTSLLNLGIKNSNQDVSLNNLIVYTDGSLNNRVRITGDTMTGNLTTPGLVVTNDVSINNRLYVGNDVSIMGELCVKDVLHVDSKLHLHPFNNINSSDGDIWIEPSTYNILFRHPITTGDASSYDLTNRLLRTPNDYINFIDSSIFTGSDYILIEQAASGYSKRRITANAFATSITGGFGQFSKYDVSLSISSTTSTTYQNKLVMTTDASAIATTYRVGWSFMMTNSNNSKQSKYRIYVDTSAAANILDEDTLDFDTGGYYNQIAGFRHINLSAGSHTIYVQYAAVTNTARIKNVRMEFWRASYTG